MINPEEFTFHNQARQLFFKNASGESAPAFACMVAGGSTTLASGDFGLSISKPAHNTDPARCCANGSVAIADTKSGEMSMDGPIVVLVSGTTVNAGDTIGPVNDSWSMTTGGAGWVAQTGETTRLGSRTVLAVPAQRRKYYGKTTTTVTAASGTTTRTLGSGTAQVYDDAGAAVSGFTLTVKNTFAHEIASGTWIHFEQFSIGSAFNVTAVECP